MFVQVSLKPFEKQSTPPVYAFCHSIEPLEVSLSSSAPWQHVPGPVEVFQSPPIAEPPSEACTIDRTCSVAVTPPDPTSLNPCCQRMFPAGSNFTASTDMSGRPDCDCEPSFSSPAATSP